MSVADLLQTVSPPGLTFFSTSRASPSLKLDREAEALLHWATSAPGAPLWSLPPHEARNEYRRVLAKTEIRAAGDPRGDRPRRAGRGAVRCACAATFRPPAGSAAEAAILFVHGGGCVVGDIESHDVLCRTLCHDTGATVFSLDYRLAPEHRIPGGGRGHCRGACNGCPEKAPSLGLDPGAHRRSSGDSAGGGLAAVALHETKGRLVSTGARPSPDLSRARSSWPPAVAAGSRRAFPDSPRPDPMVLRPLFRPRLADRRPARDPRAL